MHGLKPGFDGFHFGPLKPENNCNGVLPRYFGSTSSELARVEAIRLADNVFIFWRLISTQQSDHTTTD